MSSIASVRLPKFTRPPLIETVLGVQFQPLQGLGNAHLGIFWKRLGTEWVFASEAPPLEPQFERFGESGGWALMGLQLKLSQEMRSRLQIRNGDRMIQVQDGRLLYNWLGQGGGKYPHYHEVRPAFDSSWHEFQRFITDEKLGEPRPDQWEVTYVNHIPKGTAWNNLEDCAGLFKEGPLLEAGPAGTRLESFGGEWHYEIPPQRGRLHVQIKHGKLTSPEGPEIIFMTLTARGPISDGGVEAGLDLGHKVIVRSFFDLTSDTAHEYWGLIHDAD